MKSKFLIVFASVLAVGSVALAGCTSNNSTASSVSSIPENASEAVSEITSLIPTEDIVSSGFLDNEHRGEITDGIFTSTDGIYQITVPEGITLITATDTTTVFTADEGKITITISSEANNGPYGDLKQETFETIYSQLYAEYTTVHFEPKTIDEKQTNYRLSFTGKNNETPLQVHVLKAIKNQRAVTLQVSAEQDNEHAFTLLESLSDTLIF